jgi:hypothetical protein
MIIVELAPRYMDGSEIQAGKPCTLDKTIRQYKGIFEVIPETYYRVINALRPSKIDQNVIQAGDRPSNMRGMNSILH